MFGRKKDSPQTLNDAYAAEVEARPGAKNRPTPTRKEAEAARKQPLVPTDRKAAESINRDKLRAERERTRAAMMAGEDWALTPRDRGPQRRFIRAFIDARWNVGEFLLPVILIGMALSLMQDRQMAMIGLILDYAAILAVVVDMVLLTRKLRGLIKQKFPEGPQKGTNFYIFTRALQFRPGRIPKPHNKRGEYPPI